MSARTKAGRVRLEADIAEVQRMRALGLTPMQVLEELRKRLGQGETQEEEPGEPVGDG